MRVKIILFFCMQFLHIQSAGKAAAVVHRVGRHVTQGLFSKVASELREKILVELTFSYVQKGQIGSFSEKVIFFSHKCTDKMSSLNLC